MNTINKKQKIGIPRAISYYNDFPFYFGFFNKLGFNIIVSDKTTNKLINEGVNLVVSDTCLPIKVFVGHVVNLLEKGCDTIFVPSIQSTGYKINNCSKIRGLPEIIRNVINRHFTMIEPTLDKTEGLGIVDFCFETARQLNIEDENLIKSAIESGWKTYNNFTQMTKEGVPYINALENALKGTRATKKMEFVKPLTVAIMAHRYNLFDERVSMQLLKKLEKMGVKAYTSLNVTRQDALNSIHELDEIQYWANELDLTGTAAYFMLNNKVDGIIALSAFGCGPDSLMVDEIQYHAKQRNLPMLHLTVDEHTGEAGMVTRIEAFVDMLSRRKRKELQKELSKNKTITSNVKEFKVEKVLTKAQ